MADVAGFDRIAVGQRVKVKGLSQDGVLEAVEIEQRSPEDRVVLEGVARTVDASARSVALLGRVVEMPDTLPPIGPDGGPARLESGCPVVMTIVARARPDGLQVESVRVRPPLAFNIEKVQGHVEAVDHAAGTLVVAGVTVRASSRTTVERFA